MSVLHVSRKFYIYEEEKKKFKHPTYITTFLTFYNPASIDRGHIVLVPSACLSVCFFVCMQNNLV